jgi:transposase
MIHIQLNAATRTQLQQLRHTELSPTARDRLEMVLLSDAGWSAPRIAAHLGCHPHTARKALRLFAQQGAAGFQRRPPGPPPDQARRNRITGLLTDLLGQPRTWTSCQLAEALRSQGVVLGNRQVRRYLKLLKAGYHRTASTLKHKQDPVKVEHATTVLDSLKKKAAAGRLKLYYLDESGFSPSLPLGYSWCLPGQRKRVPYEYPQGRRVNVLAAYEPYAAEPWLGVQPLERTLTSEDLLTYLQSLPTAAVPRVVVLDNASIHVSKAFKAQRKDLSRRGIYLYYLPPYSPELNEIEPVFKQVKHHEIPQRSHTSKQELRNSVEQGFDSYAQKLRPKRDRQLRPAA